MNGQSAKPIPAGKVPPLTNLETRTFVEWVDLGAMWDGIPGPDKLSTQPAGGWEQIEVNMTVREVLVWAVVCAASWATASAQDAPVLTDVTAAAGITFHHRFGDDNLSNIVEGTGAGAMFFDYNGDGWLDIYFVCGSWNKDVNDNRGRKYRGKLSNRLYRNKQDGTFEDVTDQAGVGDPDGFGFGCSAADYDNDGDLDLYVLNYGKNVLFRNNGDGTFTDVSAKSGLDNPSWSLCAPWFDYDNDGDLDVYVVNYLKYDNGAVPRVLCGGRLSRPAQLQRRARRVVSQQWRRNLHRRDNRGRRMWIRTGAA